jgi:hypothetical protein
VKAVDDHDLATALERAGRGSAVGDGRHVVEFSGDHEHGHVGVGREIRRPARGAPRFTRAAGQATH